MNLHELSAGSRYFEGAINLGLLVKEDTALLVDSGLDEFSAKKVTKVLNENNIVLAGVILTHAHADHTGGAAFLRDRWQVPVMASPLEKPYIENPQFEPFYLFGGSQPLKELENKFLKAPACPVDISLYPGRHDILGFPLEIVALPGHSPGQIGLIYETTFYTADALFSPEILTKHGIPYFVDISASLQTMDYLASCAKPHYCFVPAHGSATSKISELVSANKKYLDEIQTLILSALSTPLPTISLLSLVCREKGLAITNAGQYYLNKAALKSFLSYLANSNKIKAIINNNILLWTR